MVHFVGAGSGAPDLITVRGQKLLAEADTVIYAGSLVNPALLDYARADAEKRRAEMKAQLAIVQSRAASGKLFGKGRLLTAFPDLRSRQHERLMEDLKKFLRTREWPERD